MKKIIHEHNYALTKVMVTLHFRDEKCDIRMNDDSTVGSTCRRHLLDIEASSGEFLAVWINSAEFQTAQPAAVS